MVAIVQISLLKVCGIINFDAHKHYFIFSTHAVPSPDVVVSASQSVLVSGFPLTLSCSITQPSSVTTPTTLMSNWTAPNSDYDRVNAVNATSVELVISSVETADSGDYICSATLTDSSGSSYIVDSQPANDTLSVTVSKC